MHEKNMQNHHAYCHVILEVIHYLSFTGEMGKTTKNIKTIKKRLLNIC